jgi:hypothetical protein
VTDIDRRERYTNLARMHRTAQQQLAIVARKWVQEWDSQGMPSQATTEQLRELVRLEAEAERNLNAHVYGPDYE